MGILNYYKAPLELAGIHLALIGALYGYPCHVGLLQALAERFNRWWNTFVTAGGEMALDLWAFHRVSGLPILGSAY